MQSNPRGGLILQTSVLPRAWVVVLVFWGFSIFAESLALAANTGGQAGAFLDYGVGARALGMGGAFYSISDDASASYWNPAGLSKLQQKELSTMQATLFSQTKYTFMGYAHPTIGKGTWALGLTQLQSTGFEKINAAFNPGTGDVTSIASAGTFADQQSAYTLSWGKEVTEAMAFGTTFKYVKHQLDSSVDSHLGMDIGMMRQMGPMYRVAVGGQNLFSKKSGDTQDNLPVTIKLGNSLSMFRDRLLFGMDLSKSQTTGLGWRFGGEFWASRWFGLRFGLLGAPVIQETDFGFGLKFQRFTLDFANGIHDLGSTTRISAAFRFGRSKDEKSNDKVKALIQSGFDAFKEGNFSMAALRFNQAVDADPRNNQVRTMLSHLQAVVSFIPQAQGGEEIQTYIRKGVMSYVDGRDMHAAVNALRYAYNKNPKDDKLLGLLNMVEKEAGVSELTHRPEGPETFTFIDQKIYDSRQAIYDGKYDLAIRRAQDILDLEPNNVTALEIMGSAFFMMEEKTKAKAVWQKVLEIDPNNKVVAEFLRQIP